MTKNKGKRSVCVCKSLLDRAVDEGKGRDGGAGGGGVGEEGREEEGVIGN